MRKALLLAKKLSLVGIGPETTPEQRRSIRFANLSNWVLVLASFVFAAVEFFGPTLPLRNFSFLMLALLCITGLVHLFFIYLGVSGLARILMALDIPAILFLFPAFTGHLGAQDLLWYPYLLAGLSILPHLLFSFRSERTLLVLSVAYWLIITLFSTRAILTSVSSASSIAPTVEYYYFYFQRTLFAVWLIVNLAVFYLNSLLANAEETKHGT